MTAVMLNIPSGAVMAIDVATLLQLCGVCGLFGVVLILAAYWPRIAALFGKRQRLVSAVIAAVVVSVSFVYINDFGMCDGWWSYICLF